MLALKLKVHLPLIENGSLEEDEDMQNRWAEMLASAASGKVD